MENNVIYQLFKEGLRACGLVIEGPQPPNVDNWAQPRKISRKNEREILRKTRESTKSQGGIF